MQTRRSLEELLALYGKIARKLGTTPGRGILMKLYDQNPELGIKESEWSYYGLTLSEFIAKAGYQPNQVNALIPKEKMLEDYARLCLDIKKIPTQIVSRAEMRKRNLELHTLESKFDGRVGVHEALQEWALTNGEAGQALLNLPGWPDLGQIGSPRVNSLSVGYVYMIKHGSRREYKIGKTNNPLRREGEISLQLPEKIEPLHYIETDDPSGIENYWHKRFDAKRKEGEWFALTPQDVAAFKRWKKIF